MKPDPRRMGAGDAERRELAQAVSALVPGPAERRPDPNTTSGFTWWLFDVTANWLILVLAIVNLALVFFDFTYVDMRHQYQRWGLTSLVDTYDRVKGIEPHRVTAAYARAAADAFRVVEDRPGSPEAQAAIADMQARSTAMLNDDPFVPAGLRGVSEQMKSKFRRHAWLHEATSAQRTAWADPWSPKRVEAKLTLHGRPWDGLSATRSMIGDPDGRILGFWTADNLQPARVRDQAAWFDTEIAPLLARNYWQTYGEDGEPNDNFWIIDCFFLPVFLGEFVIRGVLGVRRGVYRNFPAFFATRWYDAVYFVPIVVYALPPSLQGPLHLLRVISVGARMERLGLINPVAIVQAQVAKVLDRVTDLVNVKLLSNYQEGVRGFDLEATMDTLTEAQRRQLAVLIEKNLSMVVGQVLPDVMDEAERLITRTAAQALEQAPAYKQFKALPFFGGLPEQLIQKLVTETIAQAHIAMLKGINDPESVKLTKDLIHAATDSLLRHMAEVGTEEGVKAMVIDVLEEQKNRILRG